MSSKQIYYNVKGHDDETFIFLDRHDDGSYSVRTGRSIPVSHFKWEEETSTQSVEEFLASEPDYREKVQQLISEFESESNQ